MCFSTPKPPPVARVVAPPKPAERPDMVERSAEQEAQASGVAPRSDIRKFDLSLPASFTIPQ